ncbi:MAG: NAD-dependent DNA ligase LigA [Promethearchaeota archaeon]
MENEKYLVKKLEQLIRYHRNLYYNKQPEISDGEYDALIDELQKLDPNNKVFYEIGKDSATSFAKRDHIIFMNSQSKVNTVKDFLKWKKKFSCPRLIVQLKLDGISIEIQYMNGSQTFSITRGDGKVGDDITANVKKMRGYIPNIHKDFSGALRAEILMTHDIFQKKYSNQYANCRNTASGISKRKNGSGYEDLSLIYYDVFSINEKIKFNTELDKINWMKAQKFNVVDSKIFNNTEQVVKYRENTIKIRDQLDFDIDGLVVKCNEIDLEDMNRITPMKQIAFKFPSQSAISVLNDVEWSVSGGTLTPVALIDEVKIAGTKVRRASLSNPAEIERLGLKKGAIIIVSKRGDIIPKVEKVVENPSNTKDIKYPVKCESCGIKLINTGVRLFCPNEQCSSREFHRLEVWIKTLGIKNFGEKLLRKLYDNNKVKKIADLYNLKIEDISKLEGQGKRSAEIALGNLFKINEISLAKFIAGFNIENIGESIAKIIIDAGYGTLESLKNAKIEDLAKIGGIGEANAQLTINGINRLYNDMLSVLKKGIIKIKATPKEGRLKGKSFCFTGALKSITRDDAKNLLEEHGGIFKKSVIKNLDYLVTNDPNSGSEKNIKAKEYGVRIISEEQFLKFIKNEKID